MVIKISNSDESQAILADTKYISPSILDTAQEQKPYTFASSPRALYNNKKLTKAAIW